MRERPILFSGEMVRAILDGRKTQTRRVVKPGKWLDLVQAVVAVNGCWVWTTVEYDLTTPYGVPGDRLWVRETWDFLPNGRRRAMIRYWADGEHQERDVPEGFAPMLYGTERKRPSIHMPRWASRLTLEVTGVRVERVQDITAADCLAEGIVSRGYYPDGLPPATANQYVEDFAHLWRAINGPASWDANPWVWVIEFKPEEAPRG